MRVLPDDSHEVIGLDVLASPHTDIVGSIVDRLLVSHDGGNMHQAINRQGLVDHRSQLGEF